MSKWSWLVKGYAIWSLVVCMWLATGFALGWKLPAMSMGSASGSRSTGGYAPYSTWSFGK